jgi:chromosome segregation ATPase
MSEDLTKKLPRGDDNVALILQNIDSRLQRLEQTVEERVHDTRPIWQKVLADIEQLQQGQTRLEGDMHEIKGEVHEIKVSIRDIYYKMDVLNETMLNVQAKHRDVDGRVRELEAQQQKLRNSKT